MLWKIRRGSRTGIPMDVVQDTRLSDGGVRTYAAILAASATLDSAAHARKRGISLKDVTAHLEELEAAKLVTVFRSGHAWEVGVVSSEVTEEQDDEDRDERRGVVDDAHAKSKKALVEAASKRAAKKRFGSQSDDPDVPAGPKKPEVTAHTVRTRWAEKWHEKFPEVQMMAWTMEEMGIAKRLIGLVGPERIVTMVELVFAQWPRLVERYNLKGYPTIKWCMAYRGTAIQELLAGREIGRTVTRKNERERSLERSEYDDRAGDAKKAKPGQW